MDDNTELLLKTAQARQWENEERGSYDLETMRKEFRERLYPTENRTSRTSTEDRSPPATS